MRRSVDVEWLMVGAGLALAGVGWGVHLTLLALAGMLVAITAAVLWVWQTRMLDGRELPPDARSATGHVW